MGKAKICGLIIDRREVGDVGAFDNLTDEQLVEEAWRRARELGIAGPRLAEDDNKRSPQAGAEGPTSLPRHVCFTPESGHGSLKGRRFARERFYVSAKRIAGAS